MNDGMGNSVDITEIFQFGKNVELSEVFALYQFKFNVI